MKKRKAINTHSDGKEVKRQRAVNISRDGSENSKDEDNTVIKGSGQGTKAKIENRYYNYDGSYVVPHIPQSWTQRLLKQRTQL